MVCASPSTTSVPGTRRCGTCRAFPVDIVKLDRSFVVSSLENDSSVLSGLIEMAANLGMETVGEGIEEPGQLDMLRALHCRYAQGFLIARPMPSDRLEEIYAIGDVEPTPLADADRLLLMSEHLFDTLHRVPSLAERFPALRLSRQVTAPCRCTNPSSNCCLLCNEAPPWHVAAGPGCRWPWHWQRRRRAKGPGSVSPAFPTWASAPRPTWGWRWNGW